MSKLDSMASAALAYARRGWPVFPLHSPMSDGGCTCRKSDCTSSGKHPRTPRGVKDATTDLVQVEQWWSKWPDANIGVATGEQAGFWVLDVDGPEGGQSLARLEAEHGVLPATLEARTGGGRHIFFAHPQGWKATISAGRIGQGLDTRANGGYIVVAPSRHARTGTLYEWASDPQATGIVPAPEWLPTLVTKPKTPKQQRAALFTVQDDRARRYGLAALQNLENDVKGAVAGTRNDTLNRAAFRAGRLSVACGISEAMAEAMLVQAACRAGLSESEARRTFHSAWTSGLESPDGLPTAMDESEKQERDGTSKVGLLEGSDDGEPAKLIQLLHQPQSEVTVAHVLAADLPGMQQSEYRIANGRIIRQSGKKPEIVASRSIWPTALALDLATGVEWIQLTWETSRRQLVSEWHPCTIIADPVAIKDLLRKDAPVTLGRINALSNWLGDACGFLRPDRRNLLVTSRLGWVNHPEGPRFVLPGDPSVPFIRPAKPTRGNAVAWAEGLALLSAMGPAGYTGLVTIGLSAAAPLVQLLKKRNPIIGLAYESSKGKGTVLSYALSVWGDPDDYTVQATGTTEKGLQDKGLQLNDLPYWVDELHQLHKQDPRKTENVIYYLANGVRRTTSSQRQVAVGGERRFGVSFYASEEAVAELFQKGAQIRTIELEDPPLQDGAQAATLQALAKAHCGAIAPKLADLVREVSASAPMDLEKVAEEHRRQHPDLRGDDAYTVALVEAGLELLAEATALELPTVEAGRWLAALAANSRSSRPDEAQRAFDAMLSLVLSAHWIDYDGRELAQAEVGGLTLAWKARGGALDINPEHPQVAMVLKPFGGGDRHAKAWANRGLIERRYEKGRNGRLEARIKVRRAGAGGVWRIPAHVVVGTDQDTHLAVVTALAADSSR